MKLALLEGKRTRSTRQMADGKHADIEYVRSVYPDLPAMPGFTEAELEAGQQHVADDIDPSLAEEMEDVG